MAHKQYSACDDDCSNDMHPAQEDFCLHGCTRQVEGTAEREDESGHGYGQEHCRRFAGKADEQAKEDSRQKTRDQDGYYRH